MEIQILRYIDVLIGLSLVMVLASSVVTFLTQFVLWIRGLRGTLLRDGLALLIKQVEPGLSAHAKKIAEEVLKHPLVAEASGRLGTVIQREEFIRLLLEVASKAGSETLPQQARDQLKAAIGNDPAALLQAIQRRSMEIENANPWLSSHVRKAQAIIETAGGDFVARIIAWFDETSDRLTHRFAFKARIVTIAAALVVAVALPLDSLALLKRLSADDRLRESLVAQAKEIDQEQRTRQEKPANGETPTGGALAESDARKKELEIAKARMDKDLEELRKPKLDIVPTDWWVSRCYSTEFSAKPEENLLAPAMQLTVGGKVYNLRLAGTPPTLNELRDAINDLRAGVTARVEEREAADKSRQFALHLVPEAIGATLQLTRPGSGKELLKENKSFRWAGIWQALSSPGVLVTWVLLSLGAPFWYDALKNLLKLRSNLATKEQEERTERRTLQTRPGEG